MSSNKYDAFEKGAGSSVSTVSNLFDSSLTGVVFIALAVIIVGAYVAWRNTEIKFDYFIHVVLRGFAFVVFVGGFMLIAGKN